MVAHGIKQGDLSEALNRNAGYVSERVNGKRALDTDDVDALAALTKISGRDLMVELSTRARMLTVVRSVQDDADITEDEALALGAVAKTDVIDVDGDDEGNTNDERTDL